MFNIHTYIHACMHACIHTYIHACMHACIHACIHTYIHTYMYIYTISIDIFIYIYLFICCSETRENFQRSLTNWTAKSFPLLEFVDHPWSCGIGWSNLCMSLSLGPRECHPELRLQVVSVFASFLIKDSMQKWSKVKCGPGYDESPGYCCMRGKRNGSLTGTLFFFLVPWNLRDFSSGFFHHVTLW